MSSLFVQVLFWLCVAAMLHTYVTYPLSLRLLRRRYAPASDLPKSRRPSVSLLIPAYNEEAVIGGKVANALALDYDPAKLEILVGSDGSTDRTADIVRGFQDPRVKLIELSGRNGKPTVINRLAAEASGEILVISDANVQLDVAAVRKIVRHLTDPTVGVVNGGKYIRSPEGAGSVHGEVIYGNFENRLRARESAVGGLSGALGSLMAFRKSVFASYSANTICDDLDLTLHAATQGYRQVQDNEAMAFEDAAISVADEFRRRIRIGAGNFQALVRYPQLLLPWRGIVHYTYVSHKVIRWVFPFLMLGALFFNLLLLQRPLYRTIFAVQISGYAAVLLGWLLDRCRLRLPVISALYHFTALNIALLLGFFKFCSGIQSGAWERTART